MTDRITRVSFPLILEMLAPIGVNPHHVRAVFSQNPNLLGPDHKLIRIWKIEHARESGWNAAIREDVGKHVLVAQIQVLLIDGFPLRIVWRMLANARRDRPAIAG